MPLYEYRCQECNTLFEALVSLSRENKDAKRCPNCGSTNVVKLLSAAAVRTGTTGGISIMSGGCGPAGSGFS